MKILEKYRALYNVGGEGSGGGSGSPASQAPTSTPSPTTPNSGPSSGSDGAISTSDDGPGADTTTDLDFSSIFGNGPDDVGEVLPPSAPAAPKVEPPKPAGTPTPPAPPTEVKPAATPSVEPAAPAPSEPSSAQPTAPAAGSGQLDPYDPGALATYLHQNRDVAVQHVADTMFKLSTEEIEALESDVVGTVPKLLAKAYVYAQHNMLQQLARVIPQMMVKQTKLMERHTDNENKFYARWPDLKRETHGEQVLQYASVYRKMHPEASLDQIINAVGPMVMMAMNVTPTASGVPRAPASNGSRPPQPTPFMPAGPGAGGVSPPSTPSEMSPVEAMFLGDHD